MKQTTVLILFLLGVTIAYFIFIAGIFGVIWLILQRPYNWVAVCLTSLVVLFFLIIIAAALQEEGE